MAPRNEKSLDCASQVPSHSIDMIFECYSMLILLSEPDDEMLSSMKTIHLNWMNQSSLVISSTRVMHDSRSVPLTIVTIPKE